MFELIYVVSVILYFVVVKLITAYGFSEKETEYGRSKVRVPYKTLSHKPIPQLIAIFLIGLIPFLNGVLALIGFVFASVRGFGPTPSDVSWRSKKEKSSDKPESL